MKSLGSDWRWDAWLDRTSGQVVDHFFNMAADNTMGWRRISQSGAIGDTITRTTRALPFVPVSSFYEAWGGSRSIQGQYPFLSGGGAAPDGWGAIWRADAASARAVLVRIGRNDTIARTDLELPRVPVLPAEREQVIARLQRKVSEYKNHTFQPSRIRTFKPPIARLVVDAERRLWVQHTARFGDSTITFDVHDRGGKHLFRVRLPQLAAALVSPIRAMGDDVWVNERVAFGPGTIVRYRLQRP